MTTGPKASPSTYRRTLAAIRNAKPVDEIALPETDREFLVLLDRGYDEAPAYARIGGVS